MIDSNDTEFLRKKLQEVTAKNDHLLMENSKLRFENESLAEALENEIKKLAEFKASLKDVPQMEEPPYVKNE